MTLKNLLHHSIRIFILFVICANTTFAEQRSSITQYGITWTFDGQYECGQFVSGDWWVVGPVTINSVSPTPTSTRNGSCLNPSPWKEGYDDRVPYAFDPVDQVTFPHTFQANQSLVSSISRPEGEEIQNVGALTAQAILTIVNAPKSSNTFRPGYCKDLKKYFTTDQLNLSLLPAVAPPASKPDVNDITPYYSKPRIDHLSKFTIQWGCAEENWTSGPLTGWDHPCYGRGLSELLSFASLYLMLDVTDKAELAYKLVQLGIDYYAVLEGGGAWRADGGHHSARKFPVLLAGKLLNDPDMLSAGVEHWGEFGPDKQTYYGIEGVALFGNDCDDPNEYYTCNSGKKDCRDPEGLVDGCPTYIDNQTSRTWVGQALAALMFDIKSEWNHDPFFDYVDRWMNGEVPPYYSPYTNGSFIADMWNIYRNNLPGSGGTIIDVTGVAVSPTNISIDEGTSAVLTETISPSDATIQSVTWSSSNSAVAAVDGNGTVTAVSPGSCTITVTTFDGGFTDNCFVTVNSIGTNVALNKSVTESAYQDDASGTFPGANIVDGDVSDDSRWSVSGFPQWAEIDLGADFDLTRIDVSPYQNRAYQYIIEGKPNGGSYSTIVDRSSNTESDDNFYDYVSATARYLKITVSGISGNTSTWVSLTELKAYTNGGTPPSGNEFYCSPSGSMSNNGTSPSTPWADLETTVSQKTFNDGATIYLMDGNHGDPVITESNTGMVTITKYVSASPAISSIDIDDADYWTIIDVKISANGATLPNQNVPLTHPVYPLGENALVGINNSNNITIENCEINSLEDNSVWTTADDWNYNAWNGIMVGGGTDVTITGCHIKNVNFGNTAGGSSNYVFRNNIIENFGGDGMQLGSNYAKIENNTFMNCYNTNGNHDDILQFYAGTGNHYGVEIRGNKLINYTDPAQPFLGEAQGIALFDGMHNNFVIENNLVVTDNWHGITILGATNCVVNNNTVVEINQTGIGPCWIQIAAAKDGTLSTGNIIRNNITTAMNNDAGIGTVENNDVISWSEYDTYFADFINFDLHLDAGSPAIDAGTSTTAPPVDIDGISRPQGSGYDLGCYEFNGSLPPSSTVTLNPVADAFVRGDSEENVNYGAENFVCVKYNNNDYYHRKGYMKFDLSAISSPVESAVLRLYINSVSDNSNHTIKLVSDDSWTETGITWANSPSAGSSVISYSVSTTDLGSYIELDIQSAIEAEAGGLLSLEISTGDGTYVEYQSRETVNKPELVIASEPASIPVTSVSVAPTSLTLDEGQTSDLTETVLPVDATDQSVSWSTSNSSVATVNSNGLVTAVSAGNAVITVTTTDGGYTAICNVTVNVPIISVTGLSVSPTSLTLDEGQTSDLTETVLPADATDQSVSWSTSNSSVATVNPNGLVTAVSAGNAVITVTTTDGGYTATCDLTVNSIIINIALNKSIIVSDFQDDAYGYKPGENLVDGDVSDDSRWSVGGFPQWAEIDLGDNYDLSSIDLYPYQNRAYQYIIEAKSSVGTYATIVDRSSNTEGADVLSDNVIATARYIKITVTGISGSTSTWVSLSELKVYGIESSTIFVTGVSVSPTTLTLDEGQTSDLSENVSPTDATDQSVSWSSSNSTVATVDANGLVTAISAGNCTITVTTNDVGITANCSVVVNAPTSSDITLNPIADAFVRGGSEENVNYGTEGFMVIKYNSNDYYHRKGFVKFDLSTISNSVESAVLRLYVNSVSANSNHSIKLVSDDSWTETGITWANAPTAGSTVVSYGVTTSDVGTYIELDVQSIVEAEAGGVLSLEITSGENTYVEYSSRETSLKPELVVTPIAAPISRTESIIASNDDLEIRSNGNSQWVGYELHRVGGGGSGYDAASVHPFQLPALDAGEVIIDASFSINLKRIANSPGANVDAYGLPYRTTSTVSVSTDYWQGSYGSDPGATAIQDDFATNSTSSGDILTSTAGNTNLVNYINAQYASGAQGGDYVFIRLNPDIANVGDYYYWEFYSANSTYKPMLDLEIGGGQSKSAFIKPHTTTEGTFNFIVYPNPVKSGSFYVGLSANSSLSGEMISNMPKKEKFVVSIYDIAGKLIYATQIESINQHTEISTYSIMEKGIYLIEISGGNNIKVVKLIVE